LALHLVSAHLVTSGLNNVNPGVHWRNDDGLTLGAYRNSFKHETYYAGLTTETEDKRFALTVGIMSNAKDHTFRNNTWGYDGCRAQHWSAGHVRGQQCTTTTTVADRKVGLLFAPSMRLGAGFRVALMGEAVHLMWEQTR
jgi:hypothetical protein